MNAPALTPTRPVPLMRQMFSAFNDGLTAESVSSDNGGYRSLKSLPDGDSARHPKQYEFIHNAAHFSALVGGIGSGKSMGGVIRDVRAAMGWIGDTRIKTPNLGMITAPTYPMLRDATLRSFRDVAGDLIKEFHKGEMVAEMVNGSEVLFRTADDPDKLRGPNLSWWHGDESAYYHGDVWRVAIGRLRQFGQGYAWLTTTPKGRNYLYKIFVLQHKDNPDYYIRKVSTHDNSYLDPEFIAGLEASYEGDYAKQELEGEFVSFEGLIYPEFSRDRHVVNADDIPRHFVRVLAGVDWGYVHPGVINVYGQTYDGRLYEVHEEYATKRGIDDWVDIAEQLRDIHRIEQFICDPSEPDYIRKFNERGLKAFQANNTVSTGIQAVKRRLSNRTDGLPGLLYYGGAVHNFAEKEQYQWAKNRETPLDVPLKTNDHTQDAERYAIMDVDGLIRKPISVSVKHTI